MIKIKYLNLEIKIKDTSISFQQFGNLILKEGVGNIPLCELNLKTRDFSFLNVKAGDIIELSISVLDTPVLKQKYIITNIITAPVNPAKGLELNISGILDLGDFSTKIDQIVLEDKTTKDVLTSFSEIPVIWDTSITPQDKQNWIRYGITELQWLKAVYKYANFDDDVPLFAIDGKKRLFVTAIKEKLSKPENGKIVLSKSQLQSNEYQANDIKYETDNTIKFLIPNQMFDITYNYLNKKRQLDDYKIPNVNYSLSSFKQTHIWLGNTYKDYFKTRNHNIANWVDFFSENLYVTLSQGWINLNSISLFSVFRVDLSSLSSFSNTDFLSTKWLLTHRTIVINSNASILYKMRLNRFREEI